MKRPISLGIFGVAVALLVLMVAVAWISVVNFRQLNSQVRAMSDYYLPLEQQLASVEILLRQQMVHMERILAELGKANPEPDVLAKESEGFDNRGINADQIVDSSRRLLSQTQQAQGMDLDRVTLALLDRQLPNIQTSRQHFHATLRRFELETREGNPRSVQIVREELLRQKEVVDEQTQKTLDLLSRLTRGAVTRAKLEEVRAVRLNWVITGVATALGLVFAAFATRSLVGPVRQLLGGTRAVESGNLEVSIDVKTPDELALLADSFNSMVAGLREKKRVTETFGKYVDPRIVSGLLENRLPAEGGQRQVMTIFFSDIAGFTHTCEGLMPDTAVRFLNGYFSFMSQIIRAEQGIIDKYIGDAVMAFWGPPFTDEIHHAELCCRASLAQLQQLEPFRRSLPELLGVRFGLPEVDVRMGIATGEVTVGNIGSDAARGYTVIGDTVNLASRLEQANKLYGTRVLVSEATRQLAGDTLAFREIDSLRVMGKTEPVRVFELVGLPDNLSTEQEEGLNKFQAALAHYRARHWEQAEDGFRQVLEVIPDDGPSRVFLKRIAAFKQVPPGDAWNAVWIAQSK